MGPRNGRVFVSYSRRDRPKLERILDAFKTHNIEIFRDLDDILPTEDWWERIKSLISQSDTVVYLISESSIDSRVCLQELAHAVSLGKRLAPVVISPVDAAAIPDVLRKLNFIFLDGDTADFDAAFGKLVDAITLDIDWVREHTRLGELARRWFASGRPWSLLLRGRDIAAAESWLVRATPDSPPPTDLHRTFIARSRQAARNRRRAWYAGGAAACIAALVGGVAVLIAEEERESARRAQLAEQARALIAKSDLVGATLLALEAVPTRRWAYLRDHETAGEQALHAALHAGPGRRMLFRHESKILAAELSADGRTVITASRDGTVRLWDLATTRQRAILSGHFGPVTELALSPDGLVIASVSDDRTARLWDPATATQRHVLAGHEGAVTNAAFSPSGDHVVTTANDGTARVWEVATGRLVSVITAGTFLQKRRKIEHAAFTSDGKAVLVIERGTRRWAALFDPGTGKEIAGLATFYRDRQPTAEELAQAGLQSDGSFREIKGLHDSDTKVDYSFDGQRAVVRRRNKLWLSDAKSGAEIKLLTNNASFLSNPYGEINLASAGAAFTPDSKRVLIGDTSAGQITVWDAGNGASICSIDAGRRLLALRMGGDALFGYVADEGPIIWNSATCALLARLDTRPIGFDEVGLSADGSRVLYREWQQLVVWDAATGRRTAVVGARNHAKDLEIAPGGRHAISIGFADSGKSELTIWDTRTGGSTPIGPVHSHTAPPEMSHDGKRALTVDGGKVKLWDLNTTKVIRSLDFGGMQIAGFNFTREPRHVLIEYEVGKPGRVYSADDGSDVAMPLGQEERFWRAHFDVLDGRTIKSEKGRTLVVDAKTEAPLYPIEAFGFGSQVSDDGSTLLSIGGEHNKTGWLYDFRTGRQIGHLHGHRDSIFRTLMTSDARRVLTVGLNDPTPLLWNGHSGKLVTALEGHSDKIEAVGFNANGSRLATGAQEAMVWDTASGRLIARISTSVDGPALPKFGKLAFDDGAGALLTWNGGDDELYSWTVPSSTDALLHHARRVVPRCLTVAERNTWGLDPRWPEWCSALGKPGRPQQPNLEMPWSERLVNGGLNLVASRLHNLRRAFLAREK